MAVFLGDFAVPHRLEIRCRIAMFELVFQDEELKVIDEKHYLLVSGADISAEDLAVMGRASL